jgi:hypothetical protein
MANTDGLVAILEDELEQAKAAQQQEREQSSYVERTRDLERTR